MYLYQMQFDIYLCYQLFVLVYVYINLNFLLLFLIHRWLLKIIELVYQIHHLISQIFRVDNLKTFNKGTSGYGFVKHNFVAPHYASQALWLRFGVWWSFVN